MADPDPFRLHLDTITSSRPVDIREQLGHADAAHSATAEAAGRLRDRGDVEPARSQGQER
jgi:hypothetical protein